jgi:hypothetical protein
MRKREVVKIDDKEFTIKELRIKDILEITQNSSFMKGALKGKSGEQSEEDFTQEIASIMEDFDKTMKYCCDFTTDDLKPLAPSEVKLLYNTFKEVNSDFLSSLKVLGVAEALLNIRDAITSKFSKTLAISLNQGI